MKLNITVLKLIYFSREYGWHISLEYHFADAISLLDFYCPIKHVLAYL